MSVGISPIFTPHHDQETRSLVASQEESLKKVIRNLNFLANAQPLCTVRFVNVNQPGVSPINQTVFQFMDGSEINSPTSPLRSVGLNLRFVPNAVDTFPRGASTAVGNPSGGSNAWSLNHDHSGSTGGMDVSGSINAEEGEDRKATVQHTHDMDEDLADGTYDWPAYIGMAGYLKIK